MNLADYVTAREAAEELDIHPEHLKALLREGRIAGEKLGNRWMVHVDTVVAEAERRKR